MSVIVSPLPAGPVRIPALSEESSAVIWTMADRHDEEAPLAPYWRSLPSSGGFGTGLGIEEAMLVQGLPRGSRLYAEAVAARKVCACVRHNGIAWSPVMCVSHQYSLNTRRVA